MRGSVQLEWWPVLVPQSAKTYKSKVGRGFESRWLRAPGGRVATVGQLLFAPRALAYSAFLPFGVGK